MKRNAFLFFFSFIFFAVACKEDSISKIGDTINQKSGIENTLLDIDNLPKYLQNELESEWWLGNLGTLSINKITQKKDGLIISLGRGKDTDSETNKKIIITEDYLIISYAIGFHEERTLIYNKNTKSHSIIDDFAADLIGKNSIKVYRDYYDSRDVQDPNYQGHIFEEGEYNLTNNIYRKLK
jgi:hypothetical protein